MFKKWVDPIVEKFSQNLKSQRYFLNRQIEVVFWSVLAEPQYNPGSCQENSHDGMMALGACLVPQKNCQGNHQCMRKGEDVATGNRVAEGHAEIHETWDEGKGEAQWSKQNCHWCFQPYAIVLIVIQVLNIGSYSPILLVCV